MSDSEAKSYKIIFTGPVAAGKSTAIISISDIPPVSTEEFASDETRDVKQNTTVAMDYGMLKLPDGDAVHLYGTPGQDRFNYMWEILTEGGIGLVLLINNTAKAPFEDLDYFIEAFGDFISDTALVIGVTHLDNTDEPSIGQYQNHLAKKDMKFPVFDVDARNKADVQILVQALLYSL